MKVSKKAYYGLRAVLTLAQSEKPLSIHAIAQSEHLPEDYLEKILQELRRGGVVEAKKGIAGGYALAKPADQLSTWDVLRILDSPIQMFVPPEKGVLPCLQVSHCQTNQVWRTLEEKIEATLSTITLGHILRSSK